MKKRLAFSCVLGASILSLRLLLALEEPAEAETREYDVGAIVDAVRNAPFILEPEGFLFLGSVRHDSSLSDGIPHFGPEERAPAGSGEASQPFPATVTSLIPRDALEDRLRELIGAFDLESDPESVRLSWAGDALLITAPAQAHDAVRSILGPLAEAARFVFSTECLLVPVEVLEGILPGWRSQGSYLAGDVFEKALADGRTRLVSTLSRNGRRAASASREIQYFVVDHEVNQTGVIPVLNPVIDFPRSGDRLEVSAALLPGGLVGLDLAVGRFQATAVKTDVGAEWGDLELPTTEETLLSASTVVVPGKVLLAGTIGGRDPIAILVRTAVRSGAAEPRAAPSGDRIVRVHNVAFLFRRLPERMWPGAAAREVLARSEPRFADVDQFFGRLGIAGQWKPSRRRLSPGSSPPRGVLGRQRSLISPSRRGASSTRYAGIERSR